MQRGRRIGRVTQASASPGGEPRKPPSHLFGFAAGGRGRLISAPKKTPPSKSQNLCMGSLVEMLQV